MIDCVMCFDTKEAMIKQKNVQNTVMIQCTGYCNM